MNPAPPANSTSLSSRSSSFGLLVAIIALLLLFRSAPALALIVGDDGAVEPVIVQIKSSLRASTELDSRLAELAAL